MEITGKIILALPEMSGTNKAGTPWKKREYVLETMDQFPRKVHFDFFGDRADQFILSPGQTVKLSFDIESREYNGRWYTNIRGWKAEQVDGNGVSQTQQTSKAPFQSVPQPPTVDAPTVDPFKSVDSSEDLPF